MTNKSENLNKKSDFMDKLLYTFEQLLFGTAKFLKVSCREAYLGYRNGFMPEVTLLKLSLCASIFFLMRADLYILKVLRLLTPGLTLSAPTGAFRITLWTIAAVLPFLIWGWRRYKILQDVIKYLNETFTATGLISNGKTPRLIRDYVTDTNSRILQFFSDGVTANQMLEKKELLENKLSIEIEKIWQDRQFPKLINIEFAQGVMPELFILDSVTGFYNFTFPIGKTRNELVIGDLTKIPHYLFAGQTGFGKSTFIRTMTSVLLANNKHLEVHFIDFKGSEAPLMEKSDRLHIALSVEDALEQLKVVKKKILERKELFSNLKVANVFDYNQKVTNKPPLARILLIVDEYADLMPNGISDDFQTKKEAVNIINWVARMGRSFGVNLVVGVQKPDTQNLDSTTKANLVGVLCFQVQNQMQSRVVLDNDRATKLDGIKGRAIWQISGDNQVVQTPILSSDDKTEITKEKKDEQRVSTEHALHTDASEQKSSGTHAAGKGFFNNAREKGNSERNSTDREATDWDKTNT